MQLGAVFLNALLVANTAITTEVLRCNAERAVDSFVRVGGSRLRTRHIVRWPVDDRECAVTLWLRHIFCFNRFTNFYA